MNNKKRTFDELRSLLLFTLLSGQLTTNQLSIKTGINWKTVEAHLTFLIGKGFVKEVVKSEYVRIFALTGEGEKFTSNISNKQISADISSEPEQEVVEL
jgi:predicted transcriptional regulator